MLTQFDLSIPNLTEEESNYEKYDRARRIKLLTLEYSRNRWVMIEVHKVTTEIYDDDVAITMALNNFTKTKV